MNLKKTAVILVIFAVAFTVWNYREFVRKQPPCEKPITYVVGTFDRRFGISQKDFLDAFSRAEAIWEKPIGKELFVYKPEGAELTVNLIYDYRQEVTSTLSNLENVVEEGETTYEMLQIKYAGLKTKYDEMKSFYETQVEEFNRQNDVYEAHVESWNAGPRTSKQEFNKLEAERIALQEAVRKLKTLEAELDSLVKEINALVETLNRVARSLNLNVETYNTVGASRGETFTGGLYSNSEVEKKIDIYEFSSQEKLVRIIAHELGHALGLEHVNDPKAIMYYLNEGDAGALTQADLVTLQALCGIK